MAFILSGAVSAAGLANSPSPKYQHDNNNTGQSQYKGPQTNKVKWKYKINGEIYSSPVIGSNGTIYIGSSNDNLYAIKPNGKLKWKYHTKGYISGSPAIDSDGTVYAGSWDGNLYAVNSNGTLKWKYKLKSNSVYTSPAIGSDGTIYIGSDCDFYAVNKAGKLKWEYHTNGNIYASPAIDDDGNIYVGSYDGNLYALNSNGTLKWKYFAGTKDWDGILLGISESPVIGPDGTIYIVNHCNLNALKSNGTLKWKYGISEGIYSSPAISSNGTIYIEDYSGCLHALNPNGTEKWKYQTDQPDVEESSEQYVTIDSDGTVYIVNRYGYLYAVNSNGTLKYRTTTDMMNTAPAISSDGTLYIASSFDSDGVLYAIADDIVTAKPKGGYYNTSKTVTLTMNKTGTIYWKYYTTNKTTAWSKYTSPISINKTSIIQFYADIAGDKSPIYTEKYIIDKTAPKIVSTNPKKDKKISKTGIITIKFSEKIKKSSNWSKISVKTKYNKKVKISKTWIKGNKLYIKTKKWSENSYYIVHIPKLTVHDYADNNLAKKYNFKFKT